MERTKEFLRAFTPRRRVVYLLGTLLLGCGIAMNTKTQLGIAPILSVAWNLSELIGVPFSVMSFFYSHSPIDYLIVRDPRRAGGMRVSESLQMPIFS